MRVGVAIKHALDRVFAAIALVIVMPVMVAIAAAVAASSRGSVMVREPRIGRDWRRFELLRFRTDGSRAGSLLRRTSLDGLPQLVNVLLGHMSVVGPRPERPERIVRLEPGVRRADPGHRVRSGMTGMAQLRGLRRRIPVADRAEWDDWYVQHWSLWLDLKILALTPLVLLRAITR